MHIRSLDTAILVHVWVPFGKKGIGRKEQAKIYRKLYGYTSSSNYGKYHYDVKGILDSFPHIRYEDGNILVREEDFPALKEFLDSNNTVYRTWRVILEKEEAEKLSLHSA